MRIMTAVMKRMTYMTTTTMTTAPPATPTHLATVIRDAKHLVVGVQPRAKQGTAVN
jgi:hypothetical protein